MKQVLHIFQKDVRHYWRESAVSIALMAAFAWNEVRGWAYGGSLTAATDIRGFFSYGFLSGLVDVLVPLAWALVTVRVIQGEALVGDRQFWITRPYQWKQLLAAKVLFTLACINLPLLILDIFLLTKAGFAPSHYLLGLLWLQLLTALFVVLPIMVLATITASIWQFGVALLVIALYMIGMAALSDQVPSSSFSSSMADGLQTVLLFGACIGVVLLQYARRKTAGSRWLLIGFAAVPLLVLVATPYQTVVAHQYPQLGAGQQPPVQLTVLSPPKKDIADKENEAKKVNIQIPLGVSGMPDDTIVVMSGVMVAIWAPDGARWNSGWQSHGITLFQEQKRTQITFDLKKNFFERVKSSPVKARISLPHRLSRREQAPLCHAGRRVPNAGCGPVFCARGICAGDSLSRGIANSFFPVDNFGLIRDHLSCSGRRVSGQAWGDCTRLASKFRFRTSGVRHQSS